MSAKQEVVEESQLPCKTQLYFHLGIWQLQEAEQVTCSCNTITQDSQAGQDKAHPACSSLDAIAISALQQSADTVTPATATSTGTDSI